MSNYKIIETAGDSSSIIETDDVEFAKWCLTQFTDVDISELIDEINEAQKDGVKIN